MRRLTASELSCWSCLPADSDQACGIADRLGWLAPWWMSDQALRHAASQQPAYAHYLHRPRLPDRPGSCWPVCVLNGSATNGLLRRAVLLPCQWVPQPEHDPCLPSSLAGLANAVRNQLQRTVTGSWALRLFIPHGEEPIDLSAFQESDFDPSSAWASLATGLILAAKDLCPDTSVWASAAWDDQIGIGSVSGIAAKLELASEWGAKYVYLPAQNHIEAEKWIAQNGNTMNIAYLAPVGSSPNPRTILEPYLNRLLVEPEPHDPWEKRVAYYETVPRFHAERFYKSCLLADAIERNRWSFRDKGINISHLVTALGTSASHVFMTGAALNVSHCLVLYKEAGMKSGIIEECQRLFNELDIACQCVAVPGTTIHDECQSIRKLVEEFTSPCQVPAQRLAFDLTPGFKSLSLALFEIAPRGSYLIYCRHQQLPDQRVKPGTESYEIWQKS